MISKKELQYVDLWAKNVPVPGIDYSINVLRHIEKCYQIYKEKYKDKEYSIIFSNSEEIEFEVFARNLCHMMGIDYNNIMSEYFYDYRINAFKTSRNDLTSIELLEQIIDNKEKVAELDNDDNNKAKAINYYKSAIKCAIFEKLSSFEDFNFAAINYKGTENYDYKNQKLLFVPSNEAVCPYFFMGIKKEMDSQKYFVYSLLAPEEPKNFFDNQEVVIPTQILVSTDKDFRKLEATPEEKLKLYVMYENIINKYGLPNRMNIFGDYLAMLNDISGQRLTLKK